MTICQQLADDNKSKENYPAFKELSMVYAYLAEYDMSLLAEIFRCRRGWFDLSHIVNGNSSELDHDF